MLAFAAFDSLTNTLDITFESGDTHVSVGNNNHFLTINGVDLLGHVQTLKRYPINQIENLTINGAAGQTDDMVRLELTDSFNQVNSPLLQNVLITDINEVYFAGELEIGNQLVIALGPDSGPLSHASEFRAIGQSVTSELTINGGTRIRVDNGSIDLSTGTNDLVGAVSVSSPSTIGTVELRDVNELVLGDIKVRHDLDLQATSIINQPGAVIRVGDTMFVNTDHGLLGDNALDYLSTRKLNFKSTGKIRMSVDTDMTLVGASFSVNASLQSTGWIRDGISAQTNVSQQFTLKASEITVGDTGTDEFNAGQLTVATTGTASIKENSTTMFSGQSAAGSLHVQSVADVLDTITAEIVVTGDAKFSGSNIILGETPGDRFEVGRLNVNTSGRVIVFSNTALTAFGSNTAIDMTLHAMSGLLSDEAGTQTVVRNQSTLSGEAITWGKDSTFITNTLTLKSTGNVTVHEINDMLLVGNSTANSFRLSSAGEISNAANATLSANYRLDLVAASTNLGNQAGDSFKFRSLRFDTAGAMHLSADSDILIVLDNHAKSMNLQSSGNINDQPGSSILIQQSAVLSGVDVVLGDGPGECFDVLSDVLAVFASGISNVAEGC